MRGQRMRCGSFVWLTRPSGPARRTPDTHPHLPPSRTMSSHKSKKPTHPDKTSPKLHTSARPRSSAGSSYWEHMRSTTPTPATPPPVKAGSMSLYEMARDLRRREQHTTADAEQEGDGPAPRSEAAIVGRASHHGHGLGSEARAKTNGGQQISKPELSLETPTLPSQPTSSSPEGPRTRPKPRPPLSGASAPSRSEGHRDRSTEVGRTQTSSATSRPAPPFASRMASISSECPSPPTRAFTPTFLTPVSPAQNGSMRATDFILQESPQGSMGTVLAERRRTRRSALERIKSGAADHVPPEKTESTAASTQRQTPPLRSKSDPSTEALDRELSLLGLGRYSTHGTYFTAECCVYVRDISAFAR